MKRDDDRDAALLKSDPWRNHFSDNAADLIAIHRWICGPEIAQQIIIRSFKRRPSSGKINQHTVECVLADMNIQINADGTCEVPA